MIKMQAAKETQIKDCREQIVNPRHPSGAVYCLKCGHYAKVNTEGICECCNTKIQKIKRHEKTMKTLKKILENCNHLIDGAGTFPIVPENLQPGWHLRIDGRTHWVPIIWLIRFAELPQVETQEGIDKWESFITSLIRETKLEFPSVIIAK